MTDDGALDTIYTFRFGEVFPADDPLSEWLVTIALAFNDVALVHGELADAFEESAYRYFYFLRLGIAHFNEAAKFLAETQGIPEVAAYVAALPEDVRTLYSDCLERYRASRGYLAQMRDVSVFHYPEMIIQVGARRRRLMQRILRDLANATTSFFKAKSGTIGASRLLFADDVASRLFQQGTSGDEELIAHHGEIRAAITSFMRFANGAIEPRLVEAFEAGRIRSAAGRPPSYAEAAEALGSSEAQAASSS